MNFAIKRWLTAALVAAVFPSMVFASHGTAVVSDIDGSGYGVFSDLYTHADGPMADHPWYTFDANAGSEIVVTLSTDFTDGGFGGGSYFWIYEVADGNAMPGDASINEGGTELTLLFNADDDPGFFGDDDQFHELTFVAPNTNQYIIQVDSWLGASGNYNLSLSVVPEPSTTVIAGILTGVMALVRRRQK